MTEIKNQTSMPSEESPNSNNQNEILSEEISDQEIRRQLITNLDDLVDRVKSTNPDYAPPPFSARRLIDLFEENLRNLSPDLQVDMLKKIRSIISEDLLDIDTWRGLWYMLNYTLEYQGDILKRRISGEYETDDWGYDEEILEAVRPFFDFLYSSYWRIETQGINNIPDEGSAILVVNHSGQIPWDGTMLVTAVLREHPTQRLVRSMYADWFPTVPFISTAFDRLGQIHASEENGIRLLESGDLVAVYPEGFKGIGKRYKDRYRLESFGRGGFVRMSLLTNSPIIPVSIVGAEETYISLFKSRTLANIFKLPYFPISPTFPWLGLLGLIPLPTKWFIDIGDPVIFEGYSADAVDNLVLVTQLSDQIKNTIQKMIATRLNQRQSIFFG